MKISPLFLLITDLTEAQNGLDYAYNYADDYEIYYDDLGNKKKKKKNKNKNNNNYKPPQASATYANSGWAPNQSWGNTNAAKGEYWLIF